MHLRTNPAHSAQPTNNQRKIDSMAHYYIKTGEGIQTAHHLTESQARKQGAFASVTTALGAIKDTFLDEVWKPKKLVLSAESNPRRAGENDDEYVKRISAIMWGIRTRWDGEEFGSADFGTAIHAELEKWNLDHNYEFEHQWEMYCLGWPGEYHKLFSETLAAEKLVADEDFWIAGTIDLLALDHNGKVCLADYKVRGAFKDGKGFTAPKDIRQLAIEAEIIRKQYDLDYLPQCYSVIIDCESGEYYVNKWTPYMMEKGMREAAAIIRCYNALNGFGGAK